MIVLEMKCEVCGELSAFESFEQHYEEDRGRYNMTTRFLKREKWKFDTGCSRCVFVHSISPLCGRCAGVVFVLIHRPPDGTRCRDLDGNIKVVGRDV